LELADEEFQAGKLQEAIAIASRFPRYSAAQLVEQRISGWQSLWSEAEAIYQKQKQKCANSGIKLYGCCTPAQYQQ